jgi:hypothetical protein
MTRQRDDAALGRLDAWAHRRRPRGRAHHLVWGWTCDLLDLSYGCPVSQLTWPPVRGAVRLARWVIR